MSLFRQQRDLEELLRQPDFLIRFGRSLGAGEMVGHQLMLHDDPKLQELGKQLISRNSWFFKDKKPDNWETAPTFAGVPETGARVKP